MTSRSSVLVRTDLPQRPGCARPTARSTFVGHRRDQAICLSLPLYPELGTDGVDRVSDALRNSFSGSPPERNEASKRSACSTHLVVVAPPATDRTGTQIHFQHQWWEVPLGLRTSDTLSLDGSLVAINDGTNCQWRTVCIG